jgi:predicted O-linked N-acetylglucosamine transferase (SPINDLY family)
MSEPAVETILLAAIESHRQGDLALAEQGYRDVLDRDPAQPDACHNLGALMMVQRRYPEGLKLLKAALEAKPVEGQFWLSYADAVLRAGQAKEAMSVLRQGGQRGLGGPQFEMLVKQCQIALMSQPAMPVARAAPKPKKTAADIPAMVEAAMQMHASGQLARAAAQYREVLGIDPRNAGALHLSGVVAHQSQNPALAIELIQAAIAINPAAPEFHGNLGVVLRETHQIEAAAESYRKAIALNPGYAEAHNNLGNALRELERFEEAHASYESALKLQPKNADYHCNLADVQQEMGKFEPAFAHYNEALQLNPSHPKARMNLATAYFMFDDVANAIALYRQALDMGPNVALLHNNLGMALQAQGLHREASASFERAIELRAQYWEAHNNLLLGQHYAPHETKESMLAAAKRFSDALPARAARPNYDNPREPERRLRIGLVSADLRTHPVGFFLEGLLAHHDRANFEIVCYSNGGRADAVTRRLRDNCDAWRSLVGIADREAAAMVRRDRIDILVDLSGHTAKNRLPLFALRPAPVQASWLGYFGTTGLAEIDAVLLDDTTVLPDEEDAFVEHVVRLPGGRFCYAAPDYAPQVKPPPFLKNGYVTFGSFNNVAKITGDVLRVWAAILNAAPSARLVLKWKTLGFAGERARLRAAFESMGGDPQRLELRGPSPHAKMLDEYGDIDVALDPFPFSGGLTSCEALWMGVPVLTMPETRAVSRQTLGFLAAVEMEGDFAVVSTESYVERAVELAANPSELESWRKILRARMAASPLCDAPAFARAIEEAWRDLWRQWCVTHDIKRA